VVCVVQSMNPYPYVGPGCTWMADRLLVGILSRYVTSQLGELSLALHPSGVDKSSASFEMRRECHSWRFTGSFGAVITSGLTYLTLSVLIRFKLVSITFMGHRAHGSP